LRVTDRVVMIEVPEWLGLGLGLGLGVIRTRWAIPSRVVDTFERSGRVGKELVMVDDPTLTRIGEAVRLHHHRGQRDAARDLFARIWDEIGGEGGDPLHVCVLAHSMADLQDDVRSELTWDLRALAAADLITDERTGEAGIVLPVAGLYPSLHLNVSECYYKLGEDGRARDHLQQARATIGALGDDEYGKLIKEGLKRMTEQLGGR
jgi:hypothetical protein